MTTNKNKKIAMITIGTAFLLSLFLAAPMLGVANGPVFTTSTVTGSQSSTGFIRDENAMGDSSGGWYAKYLIDTSGYGYCVWVGIVGAIYNDSTYIYNNTGIGGRTYLAQNVSINYKKTTSLVETYQGWRTWGPLVTLKNIVQRPMLGFMDAAIDANNDLIVFFSNDTITNSSNVYNRFTATLWNAISGAVTNVSSYTQGWKYALHDIDLTVSLSTKGPAGHILFYGASMHLAWNNGTYLFHQLNGGSITTVATANFMGQCSMALSSNGQLNLVYVKGSTVLGKEVYMKTKPTSGGFTSETQVTNQGVECVTPDVFMDSNDNAHFLWSAQVNTATTGSHFRYVVRYKEGSTVYDVSTDYGGVSVLTPTTPVISYSPKGIYYNGKVNIFYIDSRAFSIYGGGNLFKLNLVWQYYGGESFANNTFRVISSTAAFDDYMVNVLKTPGDDLILSYYSTSSGPSAVNLAKIDLIAPQVIVTSPDSLMQPSSFNLNFTISESDIQTLIVSWDNGVIPSVITTDRTVPITGTGLDAVSHAYSITVIDEVGNSVTNTGHIIFTDPYMVLIIIAIAAGAAVLILLLVYYSKNKAKFLKRKLELKMGGKPTEDTTWGDEGTGEEEGSGDEEGSVNLKKDLKKVDQ